MMIQEDGAQVLFTRDAVQNNFKSSQEGRPIFDEFDFVRITTPGDTKTVIYRKATDRDKQRFSKAWELYEKGMTEAETGTPLAQWPGISKSQVHELAYVHVRTVESLASVSDANIQKMGPGYQQLKARAKQYIEAAKNDAAATQAARENEQLREEMALLREQMASLTKAKPGRPAKSTQDEE